MATDSRANSLIHSHTCRRLSCYFLRTFMLIIEDALLYFWIKNLDSKIIELTVLDVQLPPSHHRECSHKVLHAVDHQAISAGLSHPEN